MCAPQGSWHEVIFNHAEAHIFISRGWVSHLTAENLAPVFPQSLGLSVPPHQRQSVRGSFHVHSIWGSRGSWGSLAESLGVCGEGPGGSGSLSNTLPDAPEPSWALTPRVSLSQAHPTCLPQGRGTSTDSRSRSPGCCMWCGAAVSAENLKPIIKSTVSQSAFYYPHAGNSKQCQW